MAVAKDADLGGKKKLKQDQNVGSDQLIQRKPGDLLKTGGNGKNPAGGGTQPGGNGGQKKQQTSTNPFLLSNIRGDFKNLQSSVPQYQVSPDQQIWQNRLQNVGDRPTYTPGQDVQDWQTRLNQVNNARPGQFTFDAQKPTYQPSAQAQTWQDQLNALQNPGQYQQSAAVDAAMKRMQQAQEGRPEEYTSAYADRIAGLLDQMENDQGFSYDPESDPLYQNYRDQYIRLGQRAMQDTMGSAAALTGGYGSTYSQAAGQQQYQDYMTRLGEQMPGMYDRAYQQYRDSVGDRQNLLGTMANLDNTDYGRYRDTVGDWQSDRDYYTNAYNGERNFDYGQYQDRMDQFNKDRAFNYQGLQDQRNFDYGQYRDQVTDWNNDRNFNYGQYRDQMTDWQNDRNYYTQGLQDARNFGYNQYRDQVGDWDTDRNFIRNMLNDQRSQDQNTFNNQMDVWDRALQLYNLRMNNKVDDTKTQTGGGGGNGGTNPGGTQPGGTNPGGNTGVDPITGKKLNSNPPTTNTNRNIWSNLQKTNTQNGTQQGQALDPDQLKKRASRYGIK